MNTVPLSRPFTIADGTSLSTAVQTDGEPVVAVVTPATWTTAAISLQASHDNGATYNVVAVGGGEFSEAAVAANRYVPIDPYLTAGATHVKVQSGTSAAVVNQTGGDTGAVVTRGIM